MTDYEKIWDTSLRIQTTGRDETNADEYHHPYEPTPYSVLERLADSGLISKDDVVLDYGCGKGRVGFFLSYRTKAKTIGIEYDERIYESALENQKTAKAKANCLGDPSQHGIQTADQQVCRVTSGNAGKSRRQTRDRVPSAGPEHNGPQGDQDHISRVGRDIGHDPQKDDHGRQQLCRGRLHQSFQQGPNPPGLLRHAYTQHSHQHRTQRRVGGKIAHRVGKHVGQTIPGQQADHTDGGLLQLSAGNQFPGGGNVKSRADRGKQNHRQRQNGEQSDGVGQTVAHPLDAVEATVVQADF